MLAKKKSKNSFFRGMALIFALTMVLVGCMPAGPRALLKGRKSIERGDYAGAVSELKTATTLLATNANAWNYYGVALQHTGQAEDAANAYKRALELDRDLVEAHFNLGSLWLEQNKPEQARTEFTAYTLRRNSDPDGWLKLGVAQLKAGDLDQSERSFSAVISLRTNDAAALNWLGMANIQQGKASRAAQFFAWDVRVHPDFAPALLNLATVNQQYLHDNKAALDSYHAYLALNPRPANWDDVSALASSLENAEQPRATISPPAQPVERTSPPLAEAKPVQRTQAQVQPLPHTTYSNATQPKYVTHAAPPPRANTEETYTPPPSAPVQSVQVTPEQPIVTTDGNTFRATGVTTVVTGVTMPTTTQPSAQPVEPVEAPMPPAKKKPGFWHRLFGGGGGSTTTESTEAQSKYMGGGITPLPPVSDPTAQPTKSSDLPPAKPVAQPAPVFARYNYYSPRLPEKGDHSVGSPAAVAFAKAQAAEVDEKWPDALEWYQQAATLDPSWFQAQYNAGVIAHRLHNYALALPRYEDALAIQPDSVDARYNFALALKAGAYPVDAANELKKILSANPNEVRAHLTLGNICAQTLRDNDQARIHYKKVLELDPNNSQASNIRFWLSANQTQ